MAETKRKKFIDKIKKLSNRYQGPKYNEFRTKTTEYIQQKYLESIHEIENLYIEQIRNWNASNGLHRLRTFFDQAKTDMRWAWQEMRVSTRNTFRPTTQHLNRANAYFVDFPLFE